MGIRKNKKTLASVLILICLSIFAIFCLAPLVFLIKSSLRPGVEMITNGITLNFDITKWNLDGYQYLFKARDGDYIYWYRNSVLITALYTVMALFLTAFVGYGLAVYKFKGRSLIFILILVVMMVPVEIMLLPLYKLTITLHIINKYWGVILPTVVSPFAVFFFRQYAIGISRDYLDAGRIDGCTEYGIYFKIMMPLMLPAFGAMTILLTMGSWNSFIWPLIVLRDNHMLTIPIGLASILTPYGNDYDLLLAGSVMSIIPIVIIFIFNQKAFISGLTAGGVKG